MINSPAAPDSAQLSRRSFILGGVSLLGMVTLGVRLYHLQFDRAEKYRDLAEGNRVRLQVIPPSRGVLLDRNGRFLAKNRKNHRLFLNLEKNPNPLESLDKISGIIALDARKIAPIREKLKRFPFGAPILLKEDLLWDELVTVEHHAPTLPGIFIESGERRFYPLSEQAAHILGYVASVTEQDQKDSEHFYRWPDAKRGKQGMELSLEKELRGTPGLQHMEVNVRGLALQELERQPPINGADIRTSLHYELQRYTYDLLMQQLSGGAVVMDAWTGELLALASAPSFDSNVMSRGIGGQEWEALRQSEKNPLMNKAITGQYPPGSTFKMVTGLAGLTKGILTPERHVYCPGHFYLGNKRFNCWQPGGHGSVNLTHALAESCDTFFYTIGRDAGIDAIADAGRKLGLGQNTGFGLAAEKPGIMPDDAWKRRTQGQPWQGGDTINAAIGQGFVLTTPLQLAVMVARLVNGGRAVLPRLTAAEKTPKRPPLLGFAPEHLEAIVKGMDAVTNAPFGTAYGARIMNPEMAFGGKTGTAQVRRITIRGQDQNKIPWLHRHHALFVGYAPLAMPRYVTAVVVEHGGGGASVAAPVARDILQKTQELMAGNGKSPTAL